MQSRMKVRVTVKSKWMHRLRKCTWEGKGSGSLGGSASRRGFICVAGNRSDLVPGEMQFCHLESHLKQEYVLLISNDRHSTFSLFLLRSNFTALYQYVAYNYFTNYKEICLLFQAADGLYSFCVHIHERILKTFLTIWRSLYRYVEINKCKTSSTWRRTGIMNM